MQQILAFPSLLTCERHKTKRNIDLLMGTTWSGFRQMLSYQNRDVGENGWLGKKFIRDQRSAERLNVRIFRGRPRQRGESLIRGVH